MNQTLYVITNYQFNHNPLKPRVGLLDKRFLNSKKSIIYYLIDKEIPSDLDGKSILNEHQIDAELHEAGGKHLAEWSFLLAEEKHKFCQYPFFMVSSRFYEKNRWLRADLDQEWEKLFSYFNNYRFGFLPSYDRPLRWIDINWKEKLQKKADRHSFFPWTKELFLLTNKIFGINIPEDYSLVSDLQCNYTGFRDREALLEYVSFYRPLINHFFNNSYQLKASLEPYVKKTGAFKNEKPFTFWLEILSHLFFFVRNEKAFALHYDGYYEIDEKNTQFRQLESFPIPWIVKTKQSLRWFFREQKTEGFLAPLYAKINNLYRQ